MSEVLHKACDACRARKARCTMGSAGACDFCLNRRKTCSFSYIRRPRKRKIEQLDDLSVRPSPLQIDPPEKSVLGEKIETSDLYIDSLIADRKASRIPGNASHPDQLIAVLGPSPNIAFFPAKRVRAISERLGHNRLEQLLEEIKDIVAAKVKTTSSLSLATTFRDQNLESGHYFPCRETLESHVQVYFEMIHPIYPFLCPEITRRQMSMPGLLHSLAGDKAFAALYYAIVAVGCQHSEGGTFEAGTGEAWSYFERSLSYFQNIVFLRGSLTAIQALMAMAIYASTASAFQFEPLLLTEAAVMAQGLGFNRANSPHDTSHGRTLWVLYFMEKISCFTTGRSSVLQDSNISCAIPNINESKCEDYDWFFSFIKYARLVSKIQTSLFTITAVSQPPDEYNGRVQKMLEELENWRVSAPIRFRANEPFKPRLLQEALAQKVALMTHYLYLHASLTLSWTLLHSSATNLGTTQQLDLKRGLIRTARSVLELTAFVEVVPSTPIWILAVLPLSCLMILFDIVVHNPEHPETTLSLALLDIAGGHFSRIEFASRGNLPGSLLAQFAHLARQYVVDQRQRKRRGSNMALRLPKGQPEIQNPVPGMSTEFSNLPTPGIVTPDSPRQQMLGMSHEVLLEPTSTPNWNLNALDGSEQLFIPLIDDPSYRIEDLELLGIDLKDLFDFPYALPGTENGV